MTLESLVFRDLLDAAPDGIVIVDPDGRIAFTNAQSEVLFGYRRDELIGQPVEILLPEHLREQHLRHRTDYLIQSRARLMGTGLDLVARRKDGSEFPVEISLTPLARGEGILVAGTIRDITERRALEAQLRQAQRLEAVGQLAGGIAHDFNNLLTVIFGRSELLLHRLGPDESLCRHIELIKETTTRATLLTRQLLAFSRQQVLQPKVLDLSAVVAGIRSMLRRLIREDITLVTVADPARGCVHGDPGQIEQVIVNLVVNARDAMPEGGQITIETATVELDDRFVRDHPGARSGAYALLVVRDTGVGMDADTQRHLFEPFFTTKGQGTGLGLAIVYGIVKHHEGYITVESAPGRGARFALYLPRVEASAEALLPAEPLTALPRGSETILLVEDHEGVRQLVREILEARGYTLIDARHPGEALLITERRPGPIHLLLTDVVMPEMRGRELTDRLARMRPGLKVIYLSGYTADALGDLGALESTTQFLSKPFTPDNLARKVREVLDSR